MNDTLLSQLGQQLRHGRFQVPRPAPLLGRRDHLRRQGGGDGGEVLSCNILKPARSGHQRISRRQRIYFYRPLSLTLVGQEQGRQRQRKQEGQKGPDFDDRL
jgi:hypothetical protein